MRECYSQLFDIFVTHQRVVLLGTPGVGKSTAVLFFMWKLLQKEAAKHGIRVIAYRQQQQDDLFIVLRDGAVSEVRGDNLHGIDDSDVLEISDGFEPRHTHPSRRIWLVSSPRKDVWGTWQKHAEAAVYYMPTFTLPELQRCREIAFPTLGAAVVESHHERWGGSARFVLRYAKVQEQQRLMKDANEAAIHSDLDAAVAAVAASDGGTGKYSNSPHILFHVAVLPATPALPRFSSSFVVFASDFCRDIVLTVLIKRGREAVRAFLASAEGLPSMGSLRGHLFERLALSALFSLTRTWELVALDGSGTKSDITPGARPTVIFSDVDDLLRLWQQDSGTVGRPRNSNWPTWDAVTRDADTCIVTFWQMTVSSPAAHGLRVKGLQLAARLVPSGYSVRFVFVVVHHDDARPVQDPVRITITDAAAAPPWASHMPQFLLPIKLEDDILKCVGIDAAAAVNDVELEEIDDATGAAGGSESRPRPLKRSRVPDPQTFDEAS